jgi:hypothetical protein
MIAIIPVTKMPLNTRPINTTLDVLLGLAPTAVTPPYSSSPSPLRRGIYRALVRIATVALPVAVAIVFPDFDRIIAFLGSAMCIAICVILPICYYFKILGHEIGLGERVFCWGLLVVGTVCAVVGTVWTYEVPLSFPASWYAFLLDDGGHWHWAFLDSFRIVFWIIEADALISGPWTYSIGMHFTLNTLNTSNISSWLN